MIYICSINKIEDKSFSEIFNFDLYCFQWDSGGLANAPRLKFNFCLNENVSWQLREIEKYFGDDDRIQLLCNDYEMFDELVKYKIKYVHILDLLF